MNKLYNIVKLFGGFDLHSNNNYPVIIDEKDKGSIFFGRGSLFLFEDELVEIIL